VKTRNCVAASFLVLFAFVILVIYWKKSFGCISPCAATAGNWDAVSPQQWYTGRKGPSMHAPSSDARKEAAGRGCCCCCGGGWSASGEERGEGRLLLLLFV
jgi:hypothetical protein